MAQTINLTTATYDPAGIFNATWDRLKLDGNLGFYVRLDSTFGTQVFFARDPATVSVSLPVQFDMCAYSVTVYGLSGYDTQNDDVHSIQYQIPDWPPS
jgi:hypothetical protein